MSKYESINMNRALLRNGGRKAPKIIIDELKSQLLKYVRKNADRLDFDEEDLENDSVNIDWIPYQLHEVDEKLQKDTYAAYFENVIDDEGLSGFHTLDNGFSFFGLYGAPDWRGASFYIIYFDGKTIRGYVPRYGNTVIVDGKGFEESEGDYWEMPEKLLDKWYKNPKIHNLSLEDRKKVNEIIQCSNSHPKYIQDTGNMPRDVFDNIMGGTLYRIIHDYPITTEDINWSAIEEDIKSRIELI